MPVLDRPDCRLHWEAIDLVPPWRLPTGGQPPEAILFCHGVATNADIWSGWLAGLVDRYRVIRFDLRGFGRSSAPPAGGWSMVALGEDIRAVARAAGAERFHLVGESTGGTAALAMAAMDAPELLSIACVSSAHQGGRIEHVQAWRRFIAEHGMIAWSEDMMPRRFRPGGVDPALWDWFHRIQAATDPEALLACADMLVATDLAPVLDRIRIPALLIAPDGSPFVGVPIMAEIARRIPGAELMVVPAARHGLAASHGEACAEALRAFLDRHPARP